jgi:uncharacterized protein (TIGR02118 family)
MLKLMVGLKKLAHLSDDEFRRFWLEEHGPLVRDFASARRIARYVQIHPTAPPLLRGIVEKRGGVIAPFDGIAEIYWNSLEDIQAANETEEGRRAAVEIVAHERQFLELPSLQFFLGEEHTLKP